jgi:ArsR family transcriptional regulator
MSPALATAVSPDLVLRWKALADETRLAIVAVLRDGECCVCDLNDAVEVSQPLLSFHLRVLKEAGLITDRRDGRWVYYSLDRGAVVQLEKVLKTMRTARRSEAQSRRCCD